MKKLIMSISIVFVSLSALIAFSVVPAFAATPSYSVLGTWTFNDRYGVPYAHTMVIDSFNPSTGDFSGYGFYNAGPSLTWTITGNESSDAIAFTLLTGGSVPGVTLNGSGTVASATSMSGTGSQSNIPGYPSQNITWNATHATTACTKTGFYRDGINMTAALINPSGTVTGDVDATGCNVGVYYNIGTGTVDHANVFGSNYFGVLVNGDDNNVSVNISNSNIHNIGQFPFDGTQHGVAIYYRSFGAGSAAGEITGNTVSLYQKGGIAANGNATVNVTNNTVTGLGPVGFIAQNGIQLGYDATGIIEGDTVSGNYYSGDSWKSGGVLFYQPLAGTVLHPSRNNLFDNQVNFLNFGRTAPVK